MFLVLRSSGDLLNSFFGFIGFVGCFSGDFWTISSLTILGPLGMIFLIFFGLLVAANPRKNGYYRQPKRRIATTHP